ncbi:hypothetical protein ABW20_dc0101132 [Dactylellina cionopaga]|nr:hypothetical protein ABW20_dc0101132 [Dactylellina cionopaga]
MVTNNIFGADTQILDPPNSTFDKNIPTSLKNSSTLSGWTNQDGNNRITAVLQTLQKVNRCLKYSHADAHQQNNSKIPYSNSAWCHLHRRFEDPVITTEFKRSNTAAIIWRYLTRDDTAAAIEPPITVKGCYTCWCTLTCVSKWSQTRHADGHSCPYRSNILKKWTYEKDTYKSPTADATLVQLASVYVEWALRDKLHDENYTGVTYQAGLLEGIVAITKQIHKNRRNLLREESSAQTRKCNDETCRSRHIFADSARSSTIMSRVAVYLKDVTESKETPTILKSHLKSDFYSRYLAALPAFSCRMAPYPDGLLCLCGRVDGDFEGNTTPQDLFERTEGIVEAARGVSAGWAAVWLAGLEYLREQAFYHECESRDVEVSLESVVLARAVDSGLWTVIYDTDIDIDGPVDTSTWVFSSIINDIMGVKSDVESGNTPNQICTGALALGCTVEEIKYEYLVLGLRGACTQSRYRYVWGDCLYTFAVTHERILVGSRVEQERDKCDGGCRGCRIFKAYGFDDYHVRVDAVEEAMRALDTEGEVTEGLVKPAIRKLGCPKGLVDVAASVWLYILDHIDIE